LAAVAVLAVFCSAAPSLVGGLAGSLLAPGFDPRIFAFLVPMADAAGRAALSGTTALARRPQTGNVIRSPAQASPAPRFVVFQFLVGVYGGYFGAGIGILMLGAFAVMGLRDIHQMNALKTLLARLTTASRFSSLSQGRCRLASPRSWRFRPSSGLSGCPRCPATCRAGCALDRDRRRLRPVGLFLFWQRATAP